MAFLEDPRLRQRWNQISHNAEGVAENAAAGIWSFQHRYIEPCLTGVGKSLDACTGLCLGGGSEERARRARERERGARRSSVRPEFSFDFYDDWDDDDDALAGYSYYGVVGGSNSSGYGEGPSTGRSGGILGADWDRLLAGTGSARKHGGGVASLGLNGEVLSQPRPKRSMSYGTRGQSTRRKTSVQEDPTIIPSTSTFGFLGRLPFKIGGTLRYKPSAANLRDHPGADRHQGQDGESEPLLGPEDEDSGFFEDRDGLQSRHLEESGYGPAPSHHNPQRPGDAIYNPRTRKRSSTAGSGATSDSYRSRGDLFPSDGEGEEDAVALDDEFTIALDRVDDRSSGKTRFSKKKERGAQDPATRRRKRPSFGSVEASLVEQEAASAEDPLPPSHKNWQHKEKMVERDEAGDIERRRKAAARLAAEGGLGSLPDPLTSGTANHSGYDEISHQTDASESGITSAVIEENLEALTQERTSALAQPDTRDGFTPARLPHFR